VCDLGKIRTRETATMINVCNACIGSVHQERAFDVPVGALRELTAAAAAAKPRIGDHRARNQRHPSHANAESRPAEDREDRVEGPRPRRREGVVGGAPAAGPGCGLRRSTSGENQSGEEGRRKARRPQQGRPTKNHRCQERDVYVPVPVVTTP